MNGVFHLLNNWGLIYKVSLTSRGKCSHQFNINYTAYEFAVNGS